MTLRASVSVPGRPGAIDIEIAALALAQRGLVQRRQLRGLGLHRNQIARRVADGRLHPVFREVLAVGHRALPRRTLQLAAVLAAGPDALLSHLSAAELWELLDSERRLLEVTIAHRRRRPSPEPGLHCHRSRRLPPE